MPVASGGRSLQFREWFGAEQGFVFIGCFTSADVKELTNQSKSKNFPCRREQSERRLEPSASGFSSIRRIPPSQNEQ